MKVLFLHLSDMHFVSDSSYTKKDCEEIANAVAAKIICPISMIFLVLSGDIAFSGGAEEYNEAEKFVGELQASILGKVEIDKEKIKVLLVPGNHDRQYPEDRPDREDYESVLSRRKDEELKTYIDREFSMQKNFFEFLKREECPYGESEKFLQRKVIEHEGFSFEFNLLNTAPMSLLDADDRGLHYLPDDVLDQLQEPTAADFVITVMHHSTQNFNDSMRARLEDIVYTKSSIIFSGHDHYHATQRISYNDSQAVAVFCGGALSNKGDWRNSEFFICLFDTDSFQCDRYKCCLAQTDRGKFYKIDSEPSIVLPKKPSYGIPGNLQQNYVDAILSDAQYGVSKSVLDYFVFPRLRKEIVNEDTLETEISSFEDFIKELEQKKKIGIVGESGSGKTTLLKKIFEYYNKRKVVLLCSVDQIESGNRARVIKNIFEDIYGDDPIEYQKFQRMDKTQKILLVDDIHLIKQNHLGKFIEGVELEFGYIIYTSSTNVELNIEERIKMTVDKDQFTQYRLLKVYEDKRTELVSRVVQLKLHDNSECEKYVEAITTSLKKQRRYLSLTPNTILQYVTYYLQNRATGVQTDGNIFGKVFEASITSSIQRYVSGTLSVDKVYIVLDKIAYYIHSHRKYPIPHVELTSVIQQYNDEYGDDVNIHTFIDICIKAKVLLTCGNQNEYKFLNNNYLAYFVAREIRRMGVENNYVPLTDVLKYACFGINASILMFISYLTDSLYPLHLILDQAVLSVNDWEEFSFDNQDIKYLQSSKPFAVSIPTKKEIDKDQEKALEKDRDEVDSNTIDTIDIYDYKEEDLSKLTNRLSRSLSLLITVSRCFPNFEHLMKKKDKEQFVKQIYELPNKIFNAWAKDIELHKEELIRFIVEFQTNEFGRQDYKEEDALRVLQWESMSLLLELYYSAILNAYKPNSYLHLINSEYVDFGKADTYKIERILAHELAGKIDVFISECEKVYDHRVSVKNTMIRRMVRHLMMTSKKISKGQMDKAKSVFLNDQKQPDILFLRASNSSD